MSTIDGDELLSVLDQFTNVLYWYRGRVELTAAAAMIEAVDDWIAEHAAEHHHSEPFLAAEAEPGDGLSVVVAHLQAAVASLTASGARPALAFTVALTEALGEWVAAAAAEHPTSNLLPEPA